MDIRTKKHMMEAIATKLRLNFGCSVEEANEANMMKACALVLRDVMNSRAVTSRTRTRKQKKRQVHYLSMEFLMGRSLEKNAYNLGVLEPMKEALTEMGFKPAEAHCMIGVA